MPLFTINYAPLMTNFLVQQNAFRSDPIVLVDVGARGGIGREWDVLGDQIRAFCFEPDEAECRRLAATAPDNLTYIPRALGKARGRQMLYETALPDSAGLYKTRMEYFDRLLNRDNGVTVNEVEVDVVTLDDAISEFRIPPVDFIKLDVEGAELDILKGGQSLFGECSPLGVSSEVRFHAEINGSPPFAVFDQFLCERGLRLYDLQCYYQSRRALPYPGLEHYRRPNGQLFFAYTSRGQLQDGDALYFRDLLLPGNGRQVGSVPATTVLKLCAFFEIFSMNDCAAELLLACRNQIDTVVDSSKLLDLLASGTASKETTYRDYLERYFREPTPIVERADKPISKPQSWFGRLLSR